MGSYFEPSSFNDASFVKNPVKLLQGGTGNVAQYAETGTLKANDVNNHGPMLTGLLSDWDGSPTYSPTLFSRDTPFSMDLSLDNGSDPLNVWQSWDERNFIDNNWDPTLGTISRDDLAPIFKVNNPSFTIAFIATFAKDQTRNKRNYRSGTHSNYYSLTPSNGSIGGTHYNILRAPIMTGGPTKQYQNPGWTGGYIYYGLDLVAFNFVRRKSTVPYMRRLWHHGNRLDWGINHINSGWTSHTGAAQGYFSRRVTDGGPTATQGAMYAPALSGGGTYSGSHQNLSSNVYDSIFDGHPHLFVFSSKFGGGRQRFWIDGVPFDHAETGYDSGVGGTANRRNSSSITASLDLSGTSNYELYMRDFILAHPSANISGAINGSSNNSTAGSMSLEASNAHPDNGGTNPSDRIIVTEADIASGKTQASDFVHSSGHPYDPRYTSLHFPESYIKSGGTGSAILYTDRRDFDGSGNGINNNGQTMYNRDGMDTSVNFHYVGFSNRYYESWAEFLSAGVIFDDGGAFYQSASAGPPTYTQGGVDYDCSEPAENQYVIAACTETENTQIGACVTPGQNQYVSAACVPGSASEAGSQAVLSTCSEPGAGQYVSAVCAADADTVFSSCSTEVGSSKYVTALCDAGSSSVLGSDMVTATCDEPGASEWVSGVCQSGDASTLGSNAAISSCSGSGSPAYGQYLVSDCAPGSSTELGTDYAVGVCSSVPSGEFVVEACVTADVVTQACDNPADGQYVSQACVPGDLDTVGQNTQFTNCLVPSWGFAPYWRLLQTSPTGHWWGAGNQVSNSSYAWQLGNLRFNDENGNNVLVGTYGDASSRNYTASAENNSFNNFVDNSLAEFQWVHESFGTFTNSLQGNYVMYYGPPVTVSSASWGHRAAGDWIARDVQLQSSWDGVNWDIKAEILNNDSLYPGAGTFATVDASDPVADGEYVVDTCKGGNFENLGTDTEVAQCEGPDKIVFDSPGTTQTVLAAGAYQCYVIGGGGAGGSRSADNAHGGGGGGGGLAYQVINFASDTTVSITVGVGGPRGNNSDGGHGGASSFVGGVYNLLATGGMGGVGAASHTETGTGGLGGQGSGGSINGTGGSGGTTGTSDVDGEPGFDGSNGAAGGGGSGAFNRDGGVGGDGDASYFTGGGGGGASDGRSGTSFGNVAGGSGYYNGGRSALNISAGSPAYNAEDGGGPSGGGGGLMQSGISRTCAGGGGGSYGGGGGGNGDTRAGLNPQSGGGGGGGAVILVPQRYTSAACVAGSYDTLGSNTKFSSCTNCDGLGAETSACDPGTAYELGYNASCDGCSTIPSSSYVISGCDSQNDVSYAACETTIPADHYVSSLCDPGNLSTPGSNLVTEACAVAGANQYYGEPCVQGSVSETGTNSVIKTCSSCPPGYELSSPCVMGTLSVAGSDAVCVKEQETTIEFPVSQGSTPTEHQVMMTIRENMADIIPEESEIKAIVRKNKATGQTVSYSGTLTDEDKKLAIAEQYGVPASSVVIRSGKTADTFDYEVDTDDASDSYIRKSLSAAEDPADFSITSSIYIETSSGSSTGTVSVSGATEQEVQLYLSESIGVPSGAVSVALVADVATFSINSDYVAIAAAAVASEDMKDPTTTKFGGDAQIISGTQPESLKVGIFVSYTGTTDATDEAIEAAATKKEKSEIEFVVPLDPGVSASDMKKIAADKLSEIEDDSMEIKVVQRSRTQKSIDVVTSVVPTASSLSFRNSLEVDTASALGIDTMWVSVISTGTSQKIDVDYAAITSQFPLLDQHAKTKLIAASTKDIVISQVVSGASDETSIRGFIDFSTGPDSGVDVVQKIEEIIEKEFSASGASVQSTAHGQVSYAVPADVAANVYIRDKIRSGVPGVLAASLPKTNPPGNYVAVRGDETDTNSVNIINDFSKPVGEKSFVIPMDSSTDINTMINHVISKNPNTADQWKIIEREVPTKQSTIALKNRLDVSQDGLLEVVEDLISEKTGLKSVNVLEVNPYNIVWEADESEEISDAHTQEGLIDIISSHKTQDFEIQSVEAVVTSAESATTSAKIFSSLGDEDLRAAVETEMRRILESGAAVTIVTDSGDRAVEITVSRENISERITASRINNIESVSLGIKLQDDASSEFKQKPAGVEIVGKGGNIANISTETIKANIESAPQKTTLIRVPYDANISRDDILSDISSKFPGKSVDVEVYEQQIVRSELVVSGYDSTSSVSAKKAKQQIASSAGVSIDDVAIHQSSDNTIAYSVPSNILKAATQRTEAVLGSSLDYVSNGNVALKATSISSDPATGTSGSSTAELSAALVAMSHEDRAAIIKKTINDETRIPIASITVSPTVSSGEVQISYGLTPTQASGVLLENAMKNSISKHLTVEAVSSSVSMDPGISVKVEGDLSPAAALAVAKSAPAKQTTVRVPLDASKTEDDYRGEVVRRLGDTQVKNISVAKIEEDYVRISSNIKVLKTDDIGFVDVVHMNVADHYGVSTDDVIILSTKPVLDYMIRKASIVLGSSDRSSVSDVVTGATNDSGTLVIDTLTPDASSATLSGTISATSELPQAEAEAAIKTILQQNYPTTSISEWTVSYDSPTGLFSFDASEDATLEISLEKSSTVKSDLIQIKGLIGTHTTEPAGVVISIESDSSEISDMLISPAPMDHVISVPLGDQLREMTDDSLEEYIDERVKEAYPNIPNNQITAVARSQSMMSGSLFVGNFNKNQKNAEDQVQSIIAPQVGVSKDDVVVISMSANKINYEIPKHIAIKNEKNISESATISLTKSDIVINPRVEFIENNTVFEFGLVSQATEAEIRADAAKRLGVQESDIVQLSINSDLSASFKIETDTILPKTIEHSVNNIPPNDTFNNCGASPVTEKNPGLEIIVSVVPDSSFNSQAIVTEIQAPPKVRKKVIIPPTSKTEAEIRTSVQSQFGSAQIEVIKREAPQVTAKVRGDFSQPAKSDSLKTIIASTLEISEDKVNIHVGADGVATVDVDKATMKTLTPIIQNAIKDIMTFETDTIKVTPESTVIGDTNVQLGAKVSSDQSTAKVLLDLVEVVKNQTGAASAQAIDVATSETITLVATVARKTTDHPSYGVGSSLGYLINGVPGATLRFTRGKTYVIDQSDPSNADNPMGFSDADLAFVDGVTYAGTPGQAGASVTIVVGPNTPRLTYGIRRTSVQLMNRRAIAPVNLITKTFVVYVESSKFYVDGVEAPILEFNAGSSYVFDVSDTSNSGHALEITSDSGVISSASGIPGQSGSTVSVYAPSASSPNFRYTCSVHGDPMGNSILLLNTTTEETQMGGSIETEVDAEVTIATDEVIPAVLEDSVLSIEDSSVEIEGVIQGDTVDEGAEVTIESDDLGTDAEVQAALEGEDAIFQGGATVDETPPEIADSADPVETSVVAADDLGETTVTETTSSETLFDNSTSEDTTPETAFTEVSIEDVEQVTSTTTTSTSSGDSIATSAVVEETPQLTCTAPPEGYYVTDLCTETSDTLFQPCPVGLLGPGEYVKTPCVSGSISMVGAPALIQNCSVPAAGEYVSSVCVPGDEILGGGHDTGLSSCEVCVGDQISACVAGASDTVGVDTDCTFACQTAVPSGHYVSAACDEVNQTQTQFEQCEEPELGQWTSQVCAQGDYLNPGSDTVLQECDACEFGYESACAQGSSVSTGTNSVCLTEQPSVPGEDPIDNGFECSTNIPSGHYVYTYCNASLELQLNTQACSEPSTSQYAAAPCVTGTLSSVGEDTEIKQCSVCPQGYYELQGCVQGTSTSAGSDATCAACSECPPGYALDVACSLTSDVSCSAFVVRFSLRLNSMTLAQFDSPMQDAFVAGLSASTGASVGAISIVNIEPLYVDTTDSAEPAPYSQVAMVHDASIQPVNLAIVQTGLEITTDIAVEDESQSTALSTDIMTSTELVSEDTFGTAQLSQEPVTQESTFQPEQATPLSPEALQALLDDIALQGQIDQQQQVIQTAIDLYNDSSISRNPYCTPEEVLWAKQNNVVLDCAYKTPSSTDSSGFISGQCGDGAVSYCGIEAGVAKNAFTLTTSSGNRHVNYYPQMDCLNAHKHGAQDHESLQYDVTMDRDVHFMLIKSQTDGGTGKAPKTTFEAENSYELARKYKDDGAVELKIGNDGNFAEIFGDTNADPRIDYAFLDGKSASMTMDDGIPEAKMSLVSNKLKFEDQVACAMQPYDTVITAERFTGQTTAASKCASSPVTITVSSEYIGPGDSVYKYTTSDSEGNGALFGCISVSRGSTLTIYAVGDYADLVTHPITITEYNDQGQAATPLTFTRTETGGQNNTGTYTLTWTVPNDLTVDKYQYQCENHAHMRGTIYVDASPCDSISLDPSLSETNESGDAAYNDISDASAINSLATPYTFLGSGTANLGSGTHRRKCSTIQSTGSGLDKVWTVAGCEDAPSGDTANDTKIQPPCNPSENDITECIVDLAKICEQDTGCTGFQFHNQGTHNNGWMFGGTSDTWNLSTNNKKYHVYSRCALSSGPQNDGPQNDVFDQQSRVGGQHITPVQTLKMSEFDSLQRENYAAEDRAAEDYAAEDRAAEDTPRPREISDSIGILNNPALGMPALTAIVIFILIAIFAAKK